MDTKGWTDKQRIEKLQELMPLYNKDPNNGVDSKKRQLAIELIAGAADDWQTIRLCHLAIAMYQARQPYNSFRLTMEGQLCE